MGLTEELSISPGASTVIGGLSGMVEVFLQQPSVTWKNYMQDNRPLPLNPRLLYRGVMVNALSMAPINGIQFGVDTFLEETYAVNGQLSDGARTATATAAGAVSGLVSGPAELLMIQQQKYGGSLSERAIAVVHENGGVSILGRAMVPTLVRESIFTGAYLGVIPILNEHMATAWPGTFRDRPMLSMAVSSTIAGIGATVLTQPFDTIKTRMQANLKHPDYANWRQAGAVMWREGGMRALMSGLLPRAQRITFAVFILSEARERFTSMYIQLKKQEGGLSKAAPSPSASPSTATAAAMAAVKSAAAADAQRKTGLGLVLEQEG